MAETPTPTEATPAATTPEPATLEVSLPDDPEFDDGIDFGSFRAAPVEPAPAAAPASSTPVVVAGGEGQPPASPPAVTPATPGAAPTPAPAPAATAPAVAPAPAATVAAPAAPAPAPTPQPTMPEIERDYASWRQTRVQELASSFFKLDDNAKAVLETNPAEIVPQLMAQAHISAVESSVTAIANMLPAVIKNITEQSRRIEDGEKAFFDKFPALKDERFRAQLGQIGTVYRQMNPQVPADEFITNVGTAAMAAFGLTAAPVLQTPAPTGAPRPRPPLPLAASAPRPVGALAAQGNKFELLASEAEFD